MKTFKMLVVVMMGVLWLTSCSKENVLPTPINETEWLQKDRAVVVYSDRICDYYIVETRMGYTVIRNWGIMPPMQGDFLYGDFNKWGTADFYNRYRKEIITGQVKEYWLSWYDARQYVAYQCGR